MTKWLSSKILFFKLHFGQMYIFLILKSVCFIFMLYCTSRQYVRDIVPFLSLCRLKVIGNLILESIRMLNELFYPLFFFFFQLRL